MDATNLRLWSILGEYSDKLRNMAENSMDPNRAALLQLASQLLLEISDSVLDYRVKRSQIESLNRLIRLFKTFGLPSAILVRVKNLVLRYVDISDTSIYQADFDIIGIPA